VAPWQQDAKAQVAMAVSSRYGKHDRNLVLKPPWLPLAQVQASNFRTKLKLCDHGNWKLNIEDSCP